MARAGPDRFSLGLRLTLAFVGVSLAAVALLAGITLAATQAEIGALGQNQEHHAVGSVTSAAAAAYQRAGGWANADLSSALAVASDNGATVSVLDRAGHLVAASSGSDALTTTLGPPVDEPVIVHGAKVGKVVLRFAGSGLLPAYAALQASLVRRVAAAAALAAVLAVIVAVLVTRRIVKPVRAVTRSVRALEAGERGTRVGQLRAPGEVAELALSFDRMADAVEREDRLRRNLVADVAHELRTPVSILQASCEAILDGMAAPSLASVSSLRDEVLRLRRMIEDLQALASAEAAGLSLRPEAVELSSVAGEVARAVAAGLDDAGVEMVTSLVPVRVTGDPIRLGQIVSNLLSNAAKFTPEGGSIKLEVGPSGREARLVVSDTGIGIPDEDQPHVFERFWRGGSSAGGSGSGLAVGAELVRAHRGRVEVHSRPGQGSRFVVLLP
ncbi:MAG: sensor histidine kinase, partial [Acidimicrobiales bacterium]